MNTLEERWFAHIRSQHPELDEAGALRVAREAAGTLQEPPVSTIWHSPTLRQQAEQAFDLSYLDEAKLWLAWRVIQRKAAPKMKVWLTDFWNDPAKFVAMIRGLIVAVSGAILSGQVTLPWPKVTWFLAVFLPALAIGIPAGQKNPPPEDIKAIAHDPEIAATPKPPSS